jgi:hypothetical protein
MYNNIQIILTGLYGASKFLKWYLYQPLPYIHQYTHITHPTTMPPNQTPKTYLHIFHTKLLKNNSLKISQKKISKCFVDSKIFLIFVVLKKQRDI